MRNKIIILYFLLVNFFGLKISAQCGNNSPIDDCSSQHISMPTSVSGCAGSTYFVTPTITNSYGGTVESYTWTPSGATLATGTGSPGVTALQIPASGSTTYTLSVSGLGPNQIVDGSEFNNFGTTWCANASYLLVTNPGCCGYNMSATTNLNVCWPSLGISFPDHTATGSSKMLVVNGNSVPTGLPVTPVPFWRENVNHLCTGKNYQFSMWYANINAAHVCSLQVRINGTLMGTYSTSTILNWKKIQFNWTASASTALIEITDITTDWTSNDFMVDDISLKRVTNDVQTIRVDAVSVTATATYSGCPTLCPGMPVLMNFTGTSGATINFSNEWPTGGGSTSTVFGSPFTLPVATYPQVPPSTETTGMYTLHYNVTLEGCTIALPDVLVPIEIPDAWWDGIPTPCENEAFEIHITGTAGSIAHIDVGGVDYPVTFSGTPGTTVTSVLTWPTGISTTTTFCIVSVENPCSGCINWSPASSSLFTPCISITPTPFPVLSVSPPYDVCEGQTYTILGNATPATGTYEFSGPFFGSVTAISATPTYTMSPMSLSDAGIYYFSAYNNKCRSTMAFNVTVNPAPVDYLAGSTVCEGHLSPATVTVTGTPYVNMDYSEKHTLAGGSLSSWAGPFSEAIGTTPYTFTVPTPARVEPFPSIISIIGPRRITGPLGCDAIVGAATCSVRVYQEPHICPVYNSDDPTTLGGCHGEWYFTSDIYGADLYGGAGVTFTITCYDALHNIVLPSSSSSVPTTLSTTGWTSAPHPVTGMVTGTSPCYDYDGYITEIEINTISNGPCTWMGRCSAIRMSPKGIEASNQVVNNKSINIMPNPTKGEIVLNGLLNTEPGTNEVNIEITNVLSQVIYSKPVTVHDGNINTTITFETNVPNGMYILKIKNTKDEYKAPIVLSR